MNVSPGWHYYDRFIRDIDPNKYRFTPSDSLQTEGQRRYTQLLTLSFFGFNPEASPRRRTFVSRSREETLSLPDFFADLSSRMQPPRRTTTQLGGDEAIFGPGLEGLQNIRSRPMDALGEGSFIAGLKRTLSAVSFINGTTDHQVLYSLPGDDHDLLTHVAVLDRQSTLFTAADMNGSLFLLQKDRLLRSDPPGPPTSSVAGLFPTSPSTFLCVRKTGSFEHIDTRTNSRPAFSTGGRLSVVALHPSLPLVAAAVDEGTKIFDLRELGWPVSEVQPPSKPITAMAWHPKERLLYTAAGDRFSEVTLTPEGRLDTPLIDVKTNCVVRSILPLSSYDDTVLVQEDCSPTQDGGRCIRILHRDQSGETVINERLAPDLQYPSSGVLEKDERGLLVAFPIGEHFIYWPILHPPHEPTA